MKTRIKLLLVAATVGVWTLVPVAPVSAADCTEDLDACVNKVSCDVAGAVNKLGNKLGTGDLIYCLY